MDGEPTLEEFLAGVWEGLAVRGEASCPACGGSMEARYGAHAKPIDGRCTACGTVVS
jgi:DnaJ-class molecular chaperone